MDNKKDNKKRINLNKKTIALIAVAAILLVCLIIALATCKSGPSNNGGDTEQTSDNQQTSGDSSNAIHKHTITKVNEKAATCDKSGNIEYWYCTDCGKFFFDSQCEDEITNKNLVEISPLGHSFNEYTWGSNANAGHGGVCSVCRLEVDFEPHTFDDEANCKCGYEFPYDEYIKFTLLNDGTYEAKASTTNLPPYIAIPAIYGKKPVSSIGSYAFDECTSLKSITIPNSVTNIGSHAFEDCVGLTHMEIPDNISSVGEDAFKNCSNLYYGSYDKGLYLGNKTNPYVVFIKANSTRITSCQIHDDAKIIYSNAFSKCSSLESIIIPSNIIDIGDSAFSGCIGLTSITIPDSITSIRHNVFYGCSGLTNIVIPNSVTNIGTSAFSGCAGLKKIIIPDSVVSIGWGSFANCSNLEEMTLPFVGDKISDSSNTRLGYIFSESYYIDNTCVPTSLKKVTITRATEIGYNAFSFCSGLTSVVIPDSVTSIGSFAFSGCSGLINITIPNGITKIESNVFSGCVGLTSITIPDSVTSIDSNAFLNCSGLTKITVPDSVTSIGRGAFAGCNSLQEITLPFVGNAIYDSASTEFVYIFESWGSSSKVPYSLRKVTITKATSIGREAFQGCSGLTSVVIPDSVTSIGYSAFSGCRSLTNITIPNSVTGISVYAFENCSSLTSITIPDSVMSIGMYAFSGCSSLTNVEFENTSGWKIGNTDITVTDISTNATYLTITYRDKEWTRS